MPGLCGGSSNMSLIAALTKTAKNLGFSIEKSTVEALGLGPTCAGATA